jgi:arylsulfatase A-like enzyme
MEAQAHNIVRPCVEEPTMAEHTMTRRGFLTGAAGAATAALLDPTGRWLAAGAEAAAGPSHNPAEKPNILLIMADDLGYECLGCNGGTSYRTPNLDKLAATGVRFEHCYCTPLCSPSRNQIMTGRYGFRNYRGWGILDPKEKTFGHVLRSAGYATAVSGKWQLCRFDRPENADHPKRAGFDASCVWTWHYKGKKPSRYWDPFIWQDGKLRGDLAGKYGPDVHCDYVVDFIRRNRARPFLAYYPLNLVHAPFVATPDSKASRSAGGGSQPGKGRKGAKQANYAATVAYMDKCIGRVVGELDRLNLREKTLILFTGDNGTPRGITSRMGQSTIAGGKGPDTRPPGRSAASWWTSATSCRRWPTRAARPCPKASRSTGAASCRSCSAGQAPPASGSTSTSAAARAPSLASSSAPCARSDGSSTATVGCST